MHKATLALTIVLALNFATVIAPMNSTTAATGEAYSPTTGVAPHSNCEGYASCEAMDIATGKCVPNGDRCMTYEELKAQNAELRDQVNRDNSLRSVLGSMGFWSTAPFVGKNVTTYSIGFRESAKSEMGAWTNWFYLNSSRDAQVNVLYANLLECRADSLNDQTLGVCKNVDTKSTLAGSSGWTPHDLCARNCGGDYVRFFVSDKTLGVTIAQMDRPPQGCC